MLEPKEETEEEKQFRAIYEKIAGEVSRPPLRMNTGCMNVKLTRLFFLPPSGHADLCQRTEDGHEECPRQTWVW